MEGSVPDFPGTGMLFIHYKGILLASIFDYFCATSWLFSFQRSRNPYVGCSAFQIHQLLSNGYNLHLLHRQSLGWSVSTLVFLRSCLVSVLDLFVPLGFQSPLSSYPFVFSSHFSGFVLFSPSSKGRGGFPRVPRGCLLGWGIWTMLSSLLFPFFLRGHL